MQAQISSLSIFKLSLKKELTQKVEETRASIPDIVAKIRKCEAELDEAKKNCNQKISSLEQDIADKKKLLSEKRVELSNVPIDKASIKKDIDDSVASIERIKDKLSEL